MTNASIVEECKQVRSGASKLVFRTRTLYYFYTTGRVYCPKALKILEDNVCPKHSEGRGRTFESSRARQVKTEKPAAGLVFLLLAARP